MTVIFSDNSKTGAENWGEMARARWPVSRYYTEPTATSVDIEQLHRDVSTLPRALQALERSETAWQTPRAWTPQELFDAVADPGAFAARYLPSVAEAREALNRLEAVLGRDGAIHDCTLPGHPTPTLTLAALRSRIEDLADAATTTQHRAATAAKARKAVP